jgi:4-amino-4-deoxychorismate lyase
MLIAMIIDGLDQVEPARAVSVEDRGFQYGDGLFETALLKNGDVRFLPDHTRRLQEGCQRLGIAVPETAVLLLELSRLQATAGVRDGVVKIIVTRGAGGRGYRPVVNLRPTRTMVLYEAPDLPARSIALRWCETRLGRNARLAGIKHLNRLEQVLAQAEWHDEFDEGLMLDTEGEVVGGTASNVFIVRENVLVTPDLRFCGVAGVMRGQVLQAAQRLGIAVNVEPLWPHDIEAASELFVTNAVRGIRSAASLGTLRWAHHPVADKLRAALKV